MQSHKKLCSLEICIKDPAYVSKSFITSCSSQHVEHAAANMKQEYPNYNFPLSSHLITVLLD